jgi:CheY-like chemotaxis protein
VGQGSTFQIYLSLIDEPADRPEPEAAPASATGGSETILLVEDDEGVRDLAGDVLRMKGYTVLAAATPGEGLRICTEHAGPIELLVTDVIMPEMNGRALADRVTALRAGIKVLYMSGYTDDIIVRHGIREPSLALVEKPFTPALFARRVREMLDG